MGMGLLTAIIAALGALIAYFQFVTARRKLMLDLFDRRLKVVENVERAMGSVFSRAKVTDESFLQLMDAQAAARFLFGQDVMTFLRSVQADFAFFISHHEHILEELEDDERKKAIARKYEILNRYVEYPKTLSEIFGPYMKFTEKQTKAWLPW